MISFLQKTGGRENLKVKYFSLTKSVLFGLLVLSQSQVLASSGARIVYSQDAQGVNSVGIELKVWQGYGVTINFIPTGEVIKQVWIGDPSRISFTSNGNLCQKNSNSSNDSTDNCGNDGATVLFLRQIKPLKFPNMTNSVDGSTQITVITIGDVGQKQYQFKLTPATGQPAYTSLIIKPDSAKPAPLLLVQYQPGNATTKKPNIPKQASTSIDNQNVIAASNTSARKILTPGSSIVRDDANAVAYGLTIANRNGQVKAGSTTWNKAQDAIKLLRQGNSRQEAVSRSGIEEKVFNQLIQWGRQE